MNKYTDQRSLNYSVNELKRIETMLKRHFPNIDNPNQMSSEHAMYVDESKRLRKQVQEEASSTYQPNPLENDFELQSNASTIKSLNNHQPTKQSLSVNSLSATSNNMRQQPPQLYDPNPYTLSLDNPFYNTNEEQPYESRFVSPEERKAACDALVPNGCGARGDWRTIIIPNEPGGFDFTTACNNHDRNYSTLSFGFRRANNIFLQEMLAVPNKIIILRGRKVVITPEKTAHLYHRKVTGQDGLDAYNKAQRNAYICKHGRRPK